MGRTETRVKDAKLLSRMAWKVQLFTEARNIFRATFDNFYVMFKIDLR